MICPTCNGALWLEPPHNDPSSGLQTIRARCINNEKHSIYQTRRIPSFPPERKMIKKDFQRLQRPRITEADHERLRYLVLSGMSQRQISREMGITLPWVCRQSQIIRIVTIWAIILYKGGNDNV